MPSARLADDLTRRFRDVRRFSLELAAPLAPEDTVIQSMPDASPTRWHLAHITWFFETFILREAVAGYEPFHPDFIVLFNSYYNGVGEQFPRHLRGHVSRPALDEVKAYRRHVDAGVERLLAGAGEGQLARLAPLLEIGLHHEQQHQELMLTDIKHALSVNPLHPAYRAAQPVAGDPQNGSARPPGWRGYPEGVRWIGHDGAGFAFDNESPRHRVFCEAWEMADRLVANGEFLAFMEDGGYERPEHWLSLGWARACEEGWRAPLYWVREAGAWRQFTLWGLVPMDPHAPVCHVSYFEADAYARWAGARLPTEAEWETAAADAPRAGNFAEGARFHPLALEAVPAEAPAQMYGDVWEWTSSAYSAYPGYRPAPGAIGEYNGKFMCNQYVLRGGSCATSRSHIRPTYRNFFPPEARWQFSGIRLAR